MGDHFRDPETLPEFIGLLGTFRFSQIIDSSDLLFDQFRIREEFLDVIPFRAHPLHPRQESLMIQPQRFPERVDGVD